MESLQIELILGFDGHETHVLALHGLGNRFRVTVVVLVGLYEGAYELRWNRTHLVPLFSQCSP